MLAGDEVLATALLDRLLHHCNVVLHYMKRAPENDSGCASHNQSLFIRNSGFSALRIYYNPGMLFNVHNNPLVT